MDPLGITTFSTYQKIIRFFPRRNYQMPQLFFPVEALNDNAAKFRVLTSIGLYTKYQSTKKGVRNKNFFFVFFFSLLFLVEQKSLLFKIFLCRPSEDSRPSEDKLKIAYSI
jgi:hypothetical protein